MNSDQIQQAIYTWACTNGFNAPYGVLTGSTTSKNGTKVKTVTFGRPRTLDATVSIYNRNFILVRTSRNRQNQTFRSYGDAMAYLATL